MLSKLLFIAHLGIVFGRTIFLPWNLGDDAPPPPVASFAPPAYPLKATHSTSNKNPNAPPPGKFVVLVANKDDEGNLDGGREITLKGPPSGSMSNQPDLKTPKNFQKPLHHKMEQLHNKVPAAKPLPEEEPVNIGLRSGEFDHNCSWRTKKVKVTKEKNKNGIKLQIEQIISCNLFEIPSEGAS
jgi:hypothetical protein